ncbi:MAG: transposase, partial [Chloroflexi bacterium]|nr:transposase [Chloroflexota bacterium]
ISNIRQDALHQATSRIVAKTKPAAERPRVVVIEDLNVSGTGEAVQNHHLAQAIADVGLYEFGRQVTYKAAWAGSEVLVADRWYPSSKRCSQCGSIKDTLDLSERVYACVCCGLVLDRDLNAACNLAQLVPTASSAGSHTQCPVEACGEEKLQPQPGRRRGAGSAPRGSRNRTAV